METSIYSYICILIYLAFEFFSSFIYIYILNCILISENICNHVPTTIDTCLDIEQYTFKFDFIVLYYYYIFEIQFLNIIRNIYYF